MSLTKEQYDFSCWVIKYERLSIRCMKYQKDSLKSSDGMIVPLMWNHQHDDPSWVLGQALLENREEGIYAYFELFDTPCKWMVEQMIQHRGSVSTSPCVHKATINGGYVTSGIILEVSLTPMRIDPDTSYFPLVAETKETLCANYEKAKENVQP